MVRVRRCTPFGARLRASRWTEPDTIASQDPERDDVVHGLFEHGMGCLEGVDGDQHPHLKSPLATASKSGQVHTGQRFGGLDFLDSAQRRNEDVEWLATVYRWRGLVADERLVTVALIHSRCRVDGEIVDGGSF